MNAPWWKRRGVSEHEAAASREAVAKTRAREIDVEYARQRRRETTNRNGFGPLIEEGMSGGHTP